MKIDIVICDGCGASEEVVRLTKDAAGMDWCWYCKTVNEAPTPADLAGVTMRPADRRN